MDLTEEQSQAFDFISEQSNNATREGNRAMWRANVMANRPHFSKGNPDLMGLTAFIVAAGPSLEKNVDALRDVSERGVILALDASLRYLLGQGIRPDLCMMIDGSEKIEAMIEGCDTSGITLVCTPSSSPGVVAKWQGPRFFVTTPSAGLEKDRENNTHHLTRIVRAQKDIKAGEEIIAEEHYKCEFEGVNLTINTGGNVSTAAHHFALRALKAQQVVLMGCDLSWTHESHHYAGHEHAANTKLRAAHVAGEYMTHPDSNGGEVNTNFGLLAFKRWHEAMAKMGPGSVVNATEGGILGINKDGERAKDIEFLTGAEAVAKYAPRVQRYFPVLERLAEASR